MPPYDNYVSLREFEKACDCTLEIAEKCDIFKPDMSTKLPTIQNEKEVLWKLVCKGLIEKGLSGKKEYKNRAKFEMDRIIEKEY